MKIEFDTRYEANARGQIKRRSMRDVWINSNGMYNPVNVKSGEQFKNGQPNLVSMQKLLDYIFKRWIDSYYLLIVKFRLGNSIEHKTHLIDLPDWLDYVAFDAGPGQIMLREADFYDAHERGIRPEALMINSKAEKLFSLFEKGMQNLLTNREKRLQRQRGLFQAFSAAGEFTVDQSEMSFVP